MNSIARILIRGLVAGAGVMAPIGGASAKVAEVSDRGFIVRHAAEVPGGVDEVWALLLKPAQWWDSEHTWSGDAANLSIEPRAGGCFCEVLPNVTSPRASPRGGVEHLRVVYIERPRVLRMTGALGPLQAEAVNGTLTVQIKPVASASDKTQILLEYVVGGYARTPFPQLAPGVDGMLGEQLRRLAAKLGGDFATAFPAPDDRAPRPAPAIEPEPLPAVLPLVQEPVSPASEPVGR